VKKVDEIDFEPILSTTAEKDFFGLMLDLDLSQKDMGLLINFQMKHTEDIHSIHSTTMMTTLYDLINPIKPVEKTSHYVIFNIIDHIRLIHANKALASKMVYEYEKTNVITESWQTLSFESVLQEFHEDHQASNVAFHVDVVIVSLFRDDFKKYFLSIAKPGDCSLIIDNLPISIARSNLFLFSLNDDSIEFHKNVAPKLVEILNKMMSTICRVFDAGINDYRFLAIRLNKVMADTLEHQEICRTWLKSKLPCPCCFVKHEDLLGIAPSSSMRTEKDALESYERTMSDDPKSVEALLDIEWKSKGYRWADKKTYNEELRTYLMSRNKKKKVNMTQFTWNLQPTRGFH